MSKRKLIVLLLLLAVWEVGVWGGLLHGGLGGPMLWVSGLLLTVVAAGVVMVYVMVSRLSQRTAGPAAVAPPSPSGTTAGPGPTVVSHDEDLDVIGSMIAEANSRLARSPALASKRVKTTLEQLPLYLLAGPEGCGKTSNFMSSGLEPELLAGQVYRESALVPTRLCNVWFAGGCVFAEASGRFFTEEAGRWARLLQFLRGKRAGSLWRSLFRSGPDHRFRGLVLFCDAGNFLGVPDGPKLAALARRVQERLRIAGESFGVNFPLYVVFTKCDSIPFFGEYFGLLNEVEDQQVLGCTLPLVPAAERLGEVYAEAENKRLTAAFNDLYYALADRRIDFLARENVSTRRSPIYEFPREFRRTRPALVQFLVDVCRPNPLQPGPLLRGYYFTGSRKVAASAMSSSGRLGHSIVRLEGGATKLFSSFEELQKALERVTPEGAGEAYVSRWSFLTELFSQTILADRAAGGGGFVSRRLDLARRLLFVGTAALAAILFVLFLVSCLGNMELLAEVKEAAAGVRQVAPQAAGAADLQPLDRLREALEELIRHREAGPWRSLHWGLYAGDNVLAEARSLYCQRFREQLLNVVETGLVGSLAKPSGGYDPVYDRLKAFLMMTSGKETCTPDPAFLTPLLLEIWNTGRSTDSGRDELARRQFDHFAADLQRGSACRLDEKSDVKRVRDYLSAYQGPEKIYQQLIDEANRSAGRPARLAELAPEYQQVLTGPSEVAAAFTPAGWDFVRQKIESGRLGEVRDICVLGTAAAGSALFDSVKQGPQLQNLYIQGYIRRWQEFLAGAGVVSYRDCADGARKLELLARYDSPLLGLFFLISDHTNYTPPAPAGGGPGQPAAGAKSALDSIAPSRVRQTLETGRRVQTAIQGVTGPLLEPGHIGEAFQSVHAVVPPSSQKRWIGETNQAYISALVDLQQALEALAPGGCKANLDPGLHAKARDASMKAKGAAVLVTQRFDRTAAAGPANKEVERLLLAPIRNAEVLIVTDPGKATRDKINGELAKLCAQLKRLQDRYPFSPRSEKDVTAPELAAVFAPQGGSLWSFHQQYLAKLLTKPPGSKRWVANPADGITLTPGFEAFFNRLAVISEALFQGGGSQPQMRFTLKLQPQVGENIQSVTMALHGETLTASAGQAAVEKTFLWPGSAPRARVDARAGSTIPFSYEGLWAVFQMMGDAEPRALGAKSVELRKVRGGRRGVIEEVLGPDGRPVVVKLEVVEFPGGWDAFHPSFFNNLACLSKAVQ